MTTTEKAKSFLKDDIEAILENLATFEAMHPEIWQNVKESVLTSTDLEIGDAISVLQALTEAL